MFARQCSSFLLCFRSNGLPTFFWCIKVFYSHPSEPGRAERGWAEPSKAGPTIELCPCVSLCRITKTTEPELPGSIYETSMYNTNAIIVWGYLGKSVACRRKGKWALCSSKIHTPDSALFLSRFGCLFERASKTSRVGRIAVHERWWMHPDKLEEAPALSPPHIGCRPETRPIGSLFCNMGTWRWPFVIIVGRTLFCLRYRMLFRLFVHMRVYNIEDKTTKECWREHGKVGSCREIRKS